MELLEEADTEYIVYACLFGQVQSISYYPNPFLDLIGPCKLR
jgi:hypothetical protein